MRVHQIFHLSLISQISDTIAFVLCNLGVVASLERTASAATPFGEGGVEERDDVGLEFEAGMSTAELGSGGRDRGLKDWKGPGHEKVRGGEHPYYLLDVEEGNQ